MQAYSTLGTGVVVCCFTNKFKHLVASTNNIIGLGLSLLLLLLSVFLHFFIVSGNNLLSGFRLKDWTLEFDWHWICLFAYLVHPSIIFWKMLCLHWGRKPFRFPYNYEKKWGRKEQGWSIFIHVDFSQEII